jgi:FMN reductase
VNNGSPAEKHDASAEIVLMTGSVRPGSLTTAVMRIASAEIRGQGLTTAEINPAGVSVPYFGAGLPEVVRLKYVAQLTQARGIILCTPEYNGSYSAVMKSLIESLGYPSPLEGKIISLIGVATGVIGAVKALEHLRSVCSHCGAHVSPFALSLSEAHKFIDKNGVCANEKVLDQIREISRKLILQIG